jgi:Co/Zn/Cd efflux system component
VVADALAIAAALAGRFFGWSWLDATTGVVGRIVIFKWGMGLSKSAVFELLAHLTVEVQRCHQGHASSSSQTW